MKSPAAYYRAIPERARINLEVFVATVLVAVAVLGILSMIGCASEAERAASAAKVGGGGAAGAVIGGPMGAALGAIFAFLWSLAGSAETQVAAASLGFFARLGNAVDHLIWWAALIFMVALALLPRWRAIALDFVLGLPKAALALSRQDAPAAKAALADMALAPPRFFGAARESKRTRPSV